MDDKQKEHGITIFQKKKAVNELSHMRLKVTLVNQHYHLTYSLSQPNNQITA